MTSRRVRASSRATPWRRPCLLLANVMPLEAAVADFLVGERLALLDDVYVISTPKHAREALDVELRARVSATLGKTRACNTEGGPAPAGIADLGSEVWRRDKPPAERGFFTLGVLVGHPKYIAAQAAVRLRDEAPPLKALPRPPDLQCAWLLLLYCADPWAQHFIRNVPPQEAAPHARAHDEVGGGI